MVSFLYCDGLYYLKLCQVALEEDSEPVSNAMITQEIWSSGPANLIPKIGILRVE